MSEKRKFLVGFTRLDGVFRHVEVKEGTKIAQLLVKFGYGPNEVQAAMRDVRVNGEAVESSEYELQEDDSIALVPNTKGGA